MVELGAGAIEECESEQPDIAELRLSLPEGEAVAQWENIAASLYQAFAEQLSLPDGGFTLHVDCLELDYHAAWLQQLIPQRLTDELWLAPTTQAAAVPPGARHLLFEPHPSFGDGSHPTTKLAASATQAFCLSHAGCSVLDFGTGNGVLSLVAAVSNASSYGIDIDAAAISAAVRNAQLNQLEQRCRFAVAPIESISERFDLVVANVEPRVHFELFESVAARVNRLGELLLTGFLVEQAALIAEPLLALGFVSTTSRQAEGYLLLGFERGDTSIHRARP